MLVGSVIVAVWPFPHVAHLDRDPAVSWNDPDLVYDPDPQEGPVLVQAFRTWEEHARRHAERLTATDEQHQSLAHLFATEVVTTHLLPAASHPA